jgi:hypothetical protein
LRSTFCNKQEEPKVQKHFFATKWKNQAQKNFLNEQEEPVRKHFFATKQDRPGTGSFQNFRSTFCNEDDEPEVEKHFLQRTCRTNQKYGSTILQPNRTDLGPDSQEHFVIKQGGKGTSQKFYNRTANQKPQVQEQKTEQTRDQKFKSI